MNNKVKGFKEMQEFDISSSTIFLKMTVFDLIGKYQKVVNSTISMFLNYFVLIKVVFKSQKSEANLSLWNQSHLQGFSHQLSSSHWCSISFK